MTTYTIERMSDYTLELHAFLKNEMPMLAQTFGNKFNPANAMIRHLIDRSYFLVGKRNGEIRGIHSSWLSKSPLDGDIKLLQQQIFYVKPDSGRMTYHLFKKFIDIGKAEADHIITMLTKHTNIKPSTLKSLGFEELEVMYIMEIKK